jgi:NADH dehydrogenase FAD-containing subunit
VEVATETEESGALIWAAGIGARPLVKKLAKSLGQSDMRGLIVDEDFILYIIKSFVDTRIRRY